MNNTEPADAPGEIVTREMIRAGARAAREYLERTGGNDPATIYRAMRAVAPAAQPLPAADPELLLGWQRYEKARKFSPRQWAELHARNLAGKNFDGMIDALPSAGTPQPAAAQPGAPEPLPAAEDTALLDFLRDNTCDLRCIDVPTGGDDSEVDWIVIEHHMAKPHEREIGRGYADDPRAAIRAAIAHGIKPSAAGGA